MSQKELREALWAGVLLAKHPRISLREVPFKRGLYIIGFEAVANDTRHAADAVGDTIVAVAVEAAELGVWLKHLPDHVGAEVVNAETTTCTFRHTVAAIDNALC